MCCIFTCLEHALVFCVKKIPRVERALVLLCCIFRAWDTLWRYCVIFSVRGTRFGVILLYFRAWNTLWYLVLYFPRVERSLALLCCIFCAWNAIWRYCDIFFLLWNALFHYCVIFSARGTRSGIFC